MYFNVTCRQRVLNILSQKSYWESECVHVALLTSASTIPIMSRSTTDKGCSVLSIAASAMPVSLVTEYIATINWNELYIKQYYYDYNFFFYQLQELFLVFKQGGWKVMHPLGTRTCWKT